MDNRIYLLYRCDEFGGNKQLLCATTSRRKLEQILVRVVGAGRAKYTPYTTLGKAEQARRLKEDIRRLPLNKVSARLDMVAIDVTLNDVAIA